MAITKKLQGKRPVVPRHLDHFILPRDPGYGRKHDGKDGPSLEKLKRALFEIPTPGVYFLVEFTLRVPYKSGKHWVTAVARINGIERADDSGSYWNMIGVLNLPRTPTSKNKTLTLPFYKTYYNAHSRKGSFTF